HKLVMDGIKPGADWDAEVRKAYEGSSASVNPARSDLLFREFDYANVNNKLVIAQLEKIDRQEMSGLVRIHQAVDLTTFDGTLQRLTVSPCSCAGICCQRASTANSRRVKRGIRNALPNSFPTYATGGSSSAALLPLCRSRWSNVVANRCSFSSSGRTANA